MKGTIVKRNLIRYLPVNHFFHLSQMLKHPTIGASNHHKPLTFEVSIGLETQPTSPRIFFNFEKAKSVKFQKTLDDELQQWDSSRLIITSVDIKDYTMFITNSLITATRKAIPRSSQAIANYIISEATKFLISLKHQFYRK